MPATESICTENKEFIILQQSGVDGLIANLTWLHSNIRDLDDVSDQNFVACSTWLAHVITLSNRAYTLKELSDCAVAMFEAQRIFSAFYLFLNKVSPKFSNQKMRDLQSINDNLQSQVRIVIKNIETFMAVGYMTTGLTSEKNRTFYTEAEIKIRLIPIPDDTRGFWKLFWDNVTRFEIKSDSVLLPLFFASVFSTAVLLSIISFPLSVATVVTTAFFSFLIFQVIKFPLKMVCATLVNCLSNKKVNWGHPVTQELIDHREKLKQQKAIIVSQMENQSLKKQLSIEAEKNQELERMLKHEKNKIPPQSEKPFSKNKVLFFPKKQVKKPENTTKQDKNKVSKDTLLRRATKNPDPPRKSRGRQRTQHPEQFWQVRSLLADFSSELTIKKNKHKNTKKSNKHQNTLVLTPVAEVFTTDDNALASSHSTPTTP